MLVPQTHRTWLSTLTISCISPAVPSGRPCSSSPQTRSSSGITVTKLDMERVTQLDIVMNYIIRHLKKVGEISKKLQERRLQRYGML